MRRSKSEVYLHMVWGTKGRQALLTPEIERPVYRCIEGAAHTLGACILAIGGTEDHLHVVVRVPPRVSASTFAHHAKGISSRFIHTQFPLHDGFAWQEGYGVFSLSRPDVKRVIP